MADNSGKFPLALHQGSILAGQYIIEDVLGQGGFGITYRAVDHRSGHRVAVKEFFPESMAVRTQNVVMPFSGTRGESFAYGKTCFLQEAETLAEFIGNESIVRVYSYFEENGTAYFVMEYVEGISFDAYIKQHGGRVSYEEAERILVPVMDALAAVHSRGIVHRDVTPDNIYITGSGTVKLMDFGAARYSLGDRSRSLDVVLKHGFAPKEQYTRHGRQGAYTDVYTLGATFYFAITGRRPPDSIDRMEEDELIPPSRLGAAIPAEKEDAILMAMNVQPQNRFQTMIAFKNALSPAENPAVRSAVFVPQSAEPPKRVVPQSVMPKSAELPKPEEVPQSVMPQSAELPKPEEVPQSAKPPKPEEVPQSVGQSKPEEVPKSVMPQSVGQSKPEEVPKSVMPQSAKPPETEGKRWTTWMKIGIAVAACLIVVAIVIAVVPFGKDSVQKTSSDRQYDNLSSSNPGTSPIKLPEQLPETTTEKTEPVRDTETEAVSETTDSRPEFIKVPQLAGKTESEARQILDELLDETGYTFQIGAREEEYSEDIQAGVIMRQSPDAGSMESPDAVIDIVFSKGPEMAIVPHVVQMTRDEAVKKIEDAGLRAEIKRAYSSTVSEGRVVSQDKAEGTELRKGSTVTITVSLGKKPSDDDWNIGGGEDDWNIGGGEDDWNIGGGD